ncbi:FHA domain-containing protein [Kiritimatiellota bacterium B12222]|nr:FHA domain-containing protein [Kiritimatiellota bacterium B12222]
MVILKSLDEQIQIQIEEGQNLLLGRLSMCDIHLDDPSISSQHARLKYNNHQLRVVDMDSTNGTRLNYGLLTAPAYLMDGDTIEFGNVTFTVDGPQLESAPYQDPSAQTMTSLEPIDASEFISDTMIAPELSNEVLEEAEQALAKEEEHYANAEHNLPVHVAFALALLLLLISGYFLISELWQWSPQY